MQPRLIPITPADDSFLLEVYASSRAEELNLAPWTEEMKHAFLKSQFESQSNHYLAAYPNAAFEIIKLESEAIGRFYRTELDDEIRIIDLTILPKYRNRGIGTKLISEISGERKNKPVRIYLEIYNPSQTLFSRLGFQAVADDGVYCLWEKMPAEKRQTDEERAISITNKAD